MHLQYLTSLLPLLSLSHALPSALDYSPSVRHSSLGRRCGPVGQYFNPTPADWTAAGTDAWLNNWWDTRNASFDNSTYGFTGAFGQWALGDPDFSCQDDGSDSDCDIDDVCTNSVLNAKGNATRQAYYVLESVNRLHSYFSGLEEAFTTASIATSLSKDEWGVTFYVDKDDSDPTTFKTTLYAMGAVIGIAAAVTGPFAPVTAVVLGVASAIFSGVTSAIGLQIGAQYVRTEPYSQRHLMLTPLQ